MKSTRVGKGGTGPEGPQKKNPRKKPEGENRLSRGPKYPHGEVRSSQVLNLVNPDPSW